MAPRLPLSIHALAILCLSLSPARASPRDDPSPSVAAPRLRVLVIHVEERSAGPASSDPDPQRSVGDFLSRNRLFESVMNPSPTVSPDYLRWADVVLLEKVALGNGEPALGDEEIRALLDVVRRGKVLVVSHEAARALPASELYSTLLGRERLGRAPDRSVPIAVSVHDQSHPITQCVTHFIHRGVHLRFRALPGARVLATLRPLEHDARETAAGAGPGKPDGSGRTAPRPDAAALWITPHGRGKVVVCALDHRSGPSHAVVATLLARASQWGAGRPVTLPLGEFRTAAEGLGPSDTGLLPGLAPAPGFYRGRKIAPVMGYGAAGWLVRPEREETEMPDKVLDSLDIVPGQKIADLGAGVGYFALRLAKRVGETGRVYAVDIQQKMLDLLTENAAKADVRNITAVLATETDPRLPEGSFDLVLMVDVYHELSRPQEIMGAVRRALSATGRVALVEYRGEDPRVPIKPLHRMTIRQARAELEAVGFRLLEVKDFLPHQHVLVFGKSETATDR